jgi:Ca2+-binding RTX toxin-like protein
VLVVLAVGLAAPAVGPVEAQTPEPVKAPVGVWSGPSDSSDDDYGFLAIERGGVEEQPAFYAEAECATCDLGPCGAFGIAWGQEAGGIHLHFAADEMWCFDTGDVFLTDLSLTFTKGDTWSTLTQSGYAWTRKCGKGETTHIGTGKGETIEGTPGNDVIDGRGGNDTLVGKGGMDILCGAKGNDTLKGGPGIDILLGGGGKDKGLGGPGWDFLAGHGGKDRLKGQTGTDFLLGGGKKDHLIGGPGAGDYADGGGGNDVCKTEVAVNC